MIFIFLVRQDKHEILKHTRKNGKPKNNASNTPFQHFQEKTPPQNSETKKELSFESNTFGTELNYNQSVN